MAATDDHRANRAVPGVWRTGRALFAAQVASGALGALAWLVAARTHAAPEVGEALALVAALTWAGLIANLGLGSLLVGLLPSAHRPERPLLGGAALATALGAGLSVGLIVALGLRVAGGGISATAQDPLVSLAIVIGAAAWSVGVVVDHLAVAVDRPVAALVRAGIGGGARLAWLAAAILVGSRSASALVIGWSAALAVATAATTWGLVATGDARFRWRTIAVASGPLARRAVRTHHVINVLGQTPPMLLPIVLAVLGRPVQAAAFGAAWQVAATVGLLSAAVATGLFAAGSADRSATAATAATTRRQVLLVVAAAAVALIVAAPAILGFIGPAYADAGVAALRLLAVGLLADAAANLAVAQLRVHRAFRRAAAVNATIAIVAVGGAALAAGPLGAAGAALAWTVGQLCGCLVARSHPAARPRSSSDADLARARLAPVGAGERGGPGHPPAGGGAASGGDGGGGPARLGRRPASWTGVRYGPWPGSRGPEASGDRAS